MKNTILFSDVHLKVSDRDAPSRESFLAFLRSIDPDKTARVICLGDLFDFWYEYSHALFFGYFDVLRLLADLNDAGISLHLICGNHDFWAGNVLTEITGFHLHHEPVRLSFDKTEALLLHGDGLNPRDYGYRLFKGIARNKWAMRLFRRVHPDTAMAIAHFMSHSSRTLTGVEKPAEGPEAHFVREHAHKILQNGSASIVICGHAHAPAVEEVRTENGTGRYINPGDWQNHRSYVVFEAGQFSLHHFE